MTALRTLVVVLAITASLSACSGDPYEGYCNVVTDKQEELTKVVGEGGPDALLKALPIFRELQDAAPDDILDDWKVVVGGLTALQDALDDAGVDPATYDRDKPPEGVTQAEKARIDAAGADLATPESLAAFAAVEQQARDVCKTPLRL